MLLRLSFSEEHKEKDELYNDVTQQNLNILYENRYFGYLLSLLYVALRVVVNLKDCLVAKILPVSIYIPLGSN